MGVEILSSYETRCTKSIMKNINDACDMIATKTATKTDFIIKREEKDSKYVKNTGLCISRLHADLK